MKLRLWLIEYRGKLTQEDVASKCGISQNFYSSLETGKRQPSPKVAKRIAELLRFDWTRFYEDDERDSA